MVERSVSKSSAAASSSDEDSRPTPQKATAASESDSGSGDESEEDFELPEGYELVRGSANLPRSSILSEDKELWLFKLPKHMDASSLAGTSFDLEDDTTEGEQLAKLKDKDGYRYKLQQESRLLSSQLVNAFADDQDQGSRTLGKPFAKVLSVVQDHSSLKRKADGHMGQHKSKKRRQ